MAVRSVFTSWGVVFLRVTFMLLNLSTCVIVWYFVGKAAQY